MKLTPAKPPPIMSSKAVSFSVEILQKAILNSPDFAIIATDAKGTIQLFNTGAERLLGYAAHMRVGLQVNE